MLPVAEISFVEDVLEEGRLGAFQVVTFLKIVNSEMCENISTFRDAQERHEHNYIKLITKVDKQLSGSRVNKTLMLGSAIETRLSIHSS